jgi:hypothetical protein
MQTYMIADDNRKIEHLTIQHILQSNQYSTNIPRIKNHTTAHGSQQRDIQTKKRAVFTYHGRETRRATKLFCKAGVQIAYTISNTLRESLIKPPNNGPNTTAVYIRSHVETVDTYMSDRRTIRSKFGSKNINVTSI